MLWRVCVAVQRSTQPFNRVSPRVCRVWGVACFHNAASEAQDDMSRLRAEQIRNIGVIAHIDAGKTTTTERMLYFSNHKSRLGDIDDGSTTTDFLDQERERGITIQSALTYVKWRDTHINIIDTPGHADFAMEVERGLRVLDASVAVFDGTRGVQPQSRKVILQAQKFEQPFITFVNKMDRPRADFKGSIRSVENLLDIPVVAIHDPIVEDGVFVGLTNVVTMHTYRWQGRDITLKAVSEESEAVQTSAAQARAAMLDALSGASDVIADQYLEALDAGDETGSAISQSLIQTELGLVSRARKATVALCGSAGKNMGVEPLLDAIVDYLPSPDQRPALVAATPPGHVVTQDFLPTDPLAALVFKVHIKGKEVHSMDRSTLIRLYSGVLKVGDRVYNSSRNAYQTVKSISIVDGADESTKVDTLHPGWVASVAGLDKSYTGDTLCGSKNNAFTLTGVEAPVPVISMALEPYNEAEDKILDRALAVVQAEDPSLTYALNELGQTVISGLGALHLEVTRVKIIRGWKIDVEAGKSQFRHREYFTEGATVTHRFLTQPPDTKSGACELTLRITPIPPGSHDMIHSDNIVELSLSECEQDEEVKRRLRNRWKGPLTQGIELGLGAGVLVREPVSGMKVDVVNLEILTRGGDDTLCNAADFTTKLLMDKVKNSTKLLEPCMDLEITIFADNDVVEEVLLDLHSTKRAEVYDRFDHKNNTVIRAVAPAKTLQEYTTELSSISSGKAHYVGKLCGYRLVRDDSVLAEVKAQRGMF
eukprot:TRINITY_DN20107_c0_g1_i1.p1 TRINITY_DN20107_c0_g1~~TRINITY_DN20107_c0_g1_i1.p1  ORF type:complete len:766 (+),score=222.29 TRINITY_DN20107_c0_g1_i1:192-2489(+)